jgi:hypothetical protein
LRSLIALEWDYGILGIGRKTGSELGVKPGVKNWKGAMAYTVTSSFFDNLLRASEYPSRFRMLRGSTPIAATRR